MTGAASEGPQLSSDEVARLRHLADRSPEEIDAIIALGVGLVTAGRIRRIVMMVAMTITGGTTCWLAVVHFLDWWKHGQ